MPDPFAQGADDWLDAAGSLGTYHSQAVGGIDMKMALMDNMSMLDHLGTVENKSVVVFRKGALAPAIGDTITLNSNVYSVRGISPELSDGHFIGVFVS